MGDGDGEARSQRGALAGKGKLLRTQKTKVFRPPMLPCSAGELEVEHLQH